MKKKLILMALALWSMVSMQAYGFEVDGISYRTNSDTSVYVTSRNAKYSGSVVIPATVDWKGKTYTVTAIGYNAFYGCSGLTSVTIPNSVRLIDSYAFYGCSGLTSVIVGEGVTSIGSQAFGSCENLISVVWNAIECQDANYSEDRPFYESGKIAAITLGSKVKHIPAYLYYNMKGLTSVTIPESVTSIGACAFAGCVGLTSVTLPAGLVSIGYNAFYGCSGLTSVTIPNSVTSIGASAFSYCSGLTSVTLPAGLVSIGADAFYGCSGLTSVTIPNSVTSIGASAFSYCSGLTSVTIPNSVTSIGNNAFTGCSGLTSVTLPAGLVSIGNSAFEDCSGLTSVTLPAGLVSIGNRAFYNCSGLTSVTLPAGLTFIGDQAFYGTAIATPLYNSRVFIYMPQGYSGAYTIPSGIQRIAGSAFSGCSGLTSVTIPNSVTTIGDYAFSRCRGLTSFSLPESVDSVGDEAFRYTGIGSPLYNGKVFAYMPPSYSGAYAIPSGIQKIAGSAFRGCNNLTSVTIPNSVTMIATYAFYDCAGLTSVTIPEGVTTIGEGAFGYCDGLTSVMWNAVRCRDIDYFPYYGAPFFYYSPITSIIFGDNVAYIPAYLCYNMDGLTSVTIPVGVDSIGRAAFGYCDGLTSVTWNAVKCQNFASYYDHPFHGTTITSISFGDQVSYIPGHLSGDWDYGLASVTSVTIPERVDSVGYNAFANCENLTSITWNAVKCQDLYVNTFGWSPSVTSITFGDKVAHIPGSLCYNMDGLTSVTIPESVTTIGVYAFSGCRRLTSFSLPESLTSIGNHAFYDCDGLTSLRIPESVTTIGEYAFSSCSGLMSVTIPESVDSVGRYAFGYCENLTSVVWNAVKCRDIGYRNEWGSWNGGLFDWNTPLTSITFGDKVSRVPGGLCYGSRNLTSVTLPASVTSIGDRAFDAGWESYLIRVTSLADNPPVCEGGPFYHHKTLYVPRGCKEAYEEAPIWGYFNKIIELGNGGVVTLLVNDEDMGSVHGEGDYELGEEARLAAVPHWGYHFVRWDDGNTENPRMLTVTGDIELTAVFAKGNTINNDVPADVANENLAQAPVLVSAAQGTIQVGDAHGECVSVYNLQGIRIYHAARLTGSADIPVPNPGVYVVKVNDWTVKLMVR